MAKIATKTKLVDGVSFSFEDKAQTQLEFSMKDLSADIVKALAIHGLSQKLGDSYSGLSTVAEAISTVQDVWSNLQAGRFNATVSGTGILAEAVGRIKGIPTDEAGKRIAGLDEEALAALKKNAKVKATMDIIRGERAAKRIDTEGEDDLDI